MNTVKKLDKLLIFFFVIAIALPLLLSNKVGGGASNEENRNLAKFPTFFNQDGSLSLTGTKTGLENWINDNTFGRNILIRLNAKINYNIFKISPKSDTLIGKDNWTYFYNDDVLKHYQKLDQSSKKELSVWGNDFKNLQSYLNNNKIDFIGTIVPDKATVYPENFPSDVLQVGKQDKTDALLDQFTNVNHMDFFTPKNALIDAKKEATLYSKSFDYSHWNNYGAFIAYQELMKHVKKYYANVKILDKSDYNVVETQKSGLFQNLVPISESLYDFQPRFKSSVISQDSSFFDNFSDLNYIGRPEVVKKRFINKDTSLPKVVLVGDSMSYDYLFPFLSESFSELTFVHIDEMGKAQEVIQKAKPDLVIYECVERMFNGGVAQVEVFNQSVQNTPQSLSNTQIAALKEVDAPKEQYSGMFLDSCNKTAVSEQGKLTVSKSAGTVNLVGWAADFKASGTLRNIYVQCGDKLISGTYGIKRTSVSDYYKNTNLQNTGFEFYLTKEDLKNNTLDKISFVLVGYDGTYKFKPAQYAISYVG